MRTRECYECKKLIFMEKDSYAVLWILPNIAFLHFECACLPKYDFFDIDKPVGPVDKYL